LAGPPGNTYFRGFKKKAKQAYLLKMSSSVVKFNRKDRPEFIRELRKRVNDYFTENKISRYANGTMVFKSIFMICLYFIPFVLMLTGTVSGTWPIMGLWVLMGFGMSGIGLSIMHDANHGAYSRNKNVNRFMGFLINFIGGYHVNWKIQHNVKHHSFTNVDGHDEDIDAAGVLRLSPTKEHKKAFRFQAFYAPILYGIMTLNWAIYRDYNQLRRYHKEGLVEDQDVSYRQALALLIFNKIWYFGLLIALPIILVNIPWWQSVLGYILMQFVCGLTLALIFQTAHVIEETEFFKPAEDGSVENSWAIHQMRTTANFANGSHFFSWFVGGLNYQIEHHLFPNICHVHYKKISKIVQKTAQEFNVPYHQHRTWIGALKSHFTLLHQLGTGKYDKMLAKG
jgi:linoleoyl-CoA desaturase